MSSRKLMKIVEEIISKEDEILVPARKIYLTIKYHYKTTPLPSFLDFVNMLKRSRKFEVIESIGTSHYDLPESVEKILMQVGIYGTGPRVKFRSVKLTPKLLKEAFLKSYYKMRVGLESLLAKVSTETDLPHDEINKIISSFTELRDQINKTIQMLEKLELYETTVKPEKKKRKGK